MALFFLTRRIIHENCEKPLDMSSGLFACLCGTQDAAEAGVGAFLEKKTADWKERRDPPAPKSTLPMIPAVGIIGEKS